MAGLRQRAPIVFEPDAASGLAGAIRLVGRPVAAYEDVRSKRGGDQHRHEADAEQRSIRTVSYEHDARDGDGCAGERG